MKFFIDLFFLGSQSLEKLCNLILEVIRQFYEFHIFPRFLAENFARKIWEDFASRHEARKVFISALILL